MAAVSLRENRLLKEGGEGERGRWHQVLIFSHIFRRRHLPYYNILHSHEVLPSVTFPTLFKVPLTLTLGIIDKVALTLLPTRLPYLVM